MAHRKSLVQQTLHYFSRPHERVPAQPVDSPAAWHSADFPDDTWQYQLSVAEVAELRRAVRIARTRGKPLGALRRHDFPLPSLRTRVAQWRSELRHGRGFVVFRGVPIDSWTPAEAEVFFWCLGLHFGIPGAQNPDGDLLGHVRDQGVDYESGVRAYRTKVEISYHCDAADVVGLCCVRTARTGGRSRIASSVTIFNEIIRRRPDLAPLLFEPHVLDTRANGGVGFFPIQPARFAAGELRTFYHSDYFRSAARHAQVPELEPRFVELLDLYDDIAHSPEVYLEMDLRVGDVQLLSNHTQVHARTAYEDHDDPALKRHLLRLWISLPEPMPLRQRLLTGQARLRLLTTLVRERLRQRSA